MWGRDEGRSAVSQKLHVICKEATGAVWEERMRLASAVQLGQLLSRGSLKLVSAERCSGKIRLAAHFSPTWRRLDLPY